jgi:hypothetical protein
MFYRSKYSKVVHFAGCRYLKRLQCNRVQCIDSYAEVKEKGLRVCKCCNPVMKEYHAQTDALVTFCAENGLILFAHNDAVHFQSRFSKWKVIPHSAETFVVYHKNTTVREGDSESSVRGYHLQNLHAESLREVCEYVLDHDGYRIYHPVRKSGRKEPKPAPQKGTKRWRREQARLQKQNRRREIQNVYSLFDRLEAQKA